jgi:hypothetical protein
MNNLGKSFCLSLVWLGLLGLRGSAQDNPPPPDPSHVVFLAPDKMKWEGEGGQRHVNLVGDPAKPGLYVRLAEWLPGNMSRPHWHPNDRAITVIKGTWWVGTGDKFEPESTVPIPVGSYVTHFGKEIHYDGAKDGEVWLLMSGEGPEAGGPASTPPPAH